MNISRQFFFKNAEPIFVAAFLQIGAILITLLGVQTIHETPASSGFVAFLGAVISLISCLFVTRSLFKAILFCFGLLTSIATIMLLLAIVDFPLIQLQAAVVYLIALVWNSIWSILMGVIVEVSFWLGEAISAMFIFLKNRKVASQPS